jgi:hypothetical protein
VAEEGRACRCARELSELLEAAGWAVSEVSREDWEAAGRRVFGEVEPKLRELERCLDRKLGLLDWILNEAKKEIERKSRTDALISLVGLMSEAPHKACGR